MLSPLQQLLRKLSMLSVEVFNEYCESEKQLVLKTSMNNKNHKVLHISQSVSVEPVEKQKLNKFWKEGTDEMCEILDRALLNDNTRLDKLFFCLSKC